jgi:hypothetical protein
VQREALLLDQQVEQVLEKQELDFIAAYRVSFLVSH